MPLLEGEVNEILGLIRILGLYSGFVCTLGLVCAFAERAEPMRKHRGGVYYNVTKSFNIFQFLPVTSSNFMGSKKYFFGPDSQFFLLLLLLLLLLMMAGNHITVLQTHVKTIKTWNWKILQLDIFSFDSPFLASEVSGVQSEKAIRWSLCTWYFWVDSIDVSK